MTELTPCDVAAFWILFKICNMTMFWKSWILTYWPHSKGWWWGWVGVWGQIFATMLLHSWFSSQWSWGRGMSVGKIFATMWHVAAFLILFKICNMTMFWKSWILTPPPESQPTQTSRDRTTCFWKYFSLTLLFPYARACIMRACSTAMSME